MLYRWLVYRYQRMRLYGEKWITHRHLRRAHSRAARGKNIEHALTNIRSRKWRNGLLIEDDLYQLEADYIHHQAKHLYLLVPEFDAHSNKMAKISVYGPVAGRSPHDA